MKLSEIAENINVKAAGYRMGRFQSLRKDLKGLSRIPSRKIFTDQTMREEWAFHLGGRKEIQFNIGFEPSDENRLSNKNLFRHGIAFSLEPSQTLPDITELLLKIERFNDYVRETASEFSDMQMWHWYRSKRSENYAVQEIPATYLEPGYFIFLGKLTNLAEVDIDEVLQDFDRLLSLYEYVEGEDNVIRTVPPETDLGFQFRPGCSLKKSATVGNLPERRLNITLRHNDIEYDLFEYLRSLYGDKNVGAEVPASRGKKIDIVVKDGDTFTFYEIKISSSLQTCIREALSQLLEYSFWPDAERASKLIIVTENDSTDEAIKYLAKLRERFGLPIYHQQFDTQRKMLGKLC